MLSTDALHAMPPERTVLTLKAADLADPDTLAAVQGLRAGGVGISVRDGDLAHLGKNLGLSASYVEVRFSGADVAAQARTYAALKQSTVRMVGRPVTTWADFDACAALGLDAFVGKLHLTPRPGTPVKGMNPAQTIILQLMQMVQNNEDIPKIEGVLKRDPALSYKLLRFINSAGFGAGREIQSLRQAITHARLRAAVPLADAAAGHRQHQRLFAGADGNGGRARPPGRAARRRSSCRAAKARTCSWPACSRCSTACWACR